MRGAWSHVGSWGHSTVVTGSSCVIRFAVPERVVGDVVVLMPSLPTTANEIRWIADALDASIAEVTAA